MESQDPSIVKCPRNSGSSLISEPDIHVFFTKVDLTWANGAIEAAYSPRKRRPHLPNEPMIRAQWFKELRQIKSYRKLARVLAENNHAWAKELGFKKAPHHDSFSAYRKRVGSKRYVEIFARIRDKWKQVVETQQKEESGDKETTNEESYNEIGDFLAVDSTTVKAYSRPRRGKQCSDPDAKWGFARDPQTGKPTKVFGYKAHTVLECGKCGPVAFKVTPASHADIKEYPELLHEVRQAGFNFKAVGADAGYDSRKNNFETIFHHQAAPIIAYNRRRASKGSKGHRYDVYFPIARNSKLWKKLYRRRTAVERQFSELKEQLGFRNLTLRGLEGVTIHIALSLTVLIAINLVAHLTGNPELLRSIEPWRYL